MTAVEKIAEALMSHQRIPLLYDLGNRCVGCDNLNGKSDGSNSPRHTRHLAEAVVAAIRALTPSEQAELIGGEVGFWTGDAYLGPGSTGEGSAAWLVAHGEPARARVVGPWVEVES